MPDCNHQWYWAMTQVSSVGYKANVEIEDGKTYVTVFDTACAWNDVTDEHSAVLLCDLCNKEVEVPPDQVSWQ